MWNDVNLGQNIVIIKITEPDETMKIQSLSKPDETMSLLEHGLCTWGG